MLKAQLGRIRFFLLQDFMIDTDLFCWESVEISERDAHNILGRKNGIFPGDTPKAPNRRIAEMDRGVPEHGQALITPRPARFNIPPIEPPA